MDVKNAKMLFKNLEKLKAVPTPLIETLMLIKVYSLCVQLEHHSEEAGQLVSEVNSFDTKPMAKIAVKMSVIRVVK